ncbi:MAG: Ribonuclease D [Candidatus Tokpelaia hoelldobleri]|uniref:Ribonuclease D n=1 Tax=Candidatus Tokpelaia hoelldobleri TaxID=1902579 RepID=A0A1U9JUJ4_9HYPH|nr:MAG: Ribonuclease D [Candidatus Tokpelaia hoelldoblerii]
MKLITDTDTLAHTVELLSKSGFVTVDTEFLRETTFWPQLCLIQLASPDVAALIDPLAPGIDLAPFFTLMADKNVIKVFHAARQDIEIIHHLGNLIPEPVFDTQVAAMVCGYGDSASYDSLVAKITGHQLDKSSRFTDWSKRPLSEKQLTYALADVTWLRDVYRNLHRQLEESGRAGWLKEEMAVLANPDTYAPPLENAWKRVKGRVRKPRELAVLQQIAAWRELEAQQQNIPRGRVLKDDTLIEIAIQQPKDKTALANLRSLSKGWENSAQAAALLQAVAQGLAIPKESLPQIKHKAATGDANRSETEILKLLLKLVTEEHKVAARIVATGDDIEKIVAGQDKTGIPAMQGWRFELFGKKALAMLAGHIGIKIDNGAIRLFDIKQAEQ